MRTRRRQISHRRLSRQHPGRLQRSHRLGAGVVPAPPLTFPVYNIKPRAGEPPGSASRSTSAVSACSTSAKSSSTRAGLGGRLPRVLHDPRPAGSRRAREDPQKSPRLRRHDRKHRGRRQVPDHARAPAATPKRAASTAPSSTPIRVQESAPEDEYDVAAPAVPPAASSPARRRSSRRCRATRRTPARAKNRPVATKCRSTDRLDPAGHQPDGFPDRPDRDRRSAVQPRRDRPVQRARRQRQPADRAWASTRRRRRR